MRDEGPQYQRAPQLAVRRHDLEHVHVVAARDRRRTQQCKNVGSVALELLGHLGQGLRAALVVGQQLLGDGRVQLEQRRDRATIRRTVAIDRQTETRGQRISHTADGTHDGDGNLAQWRGTQVRRLIVVVVGSRRVADGLGSREQRRDLTEARSISEARAAELVHKELESRQWTR